MARQRDAGTGLIGSFSALVAFLALMLFAVQLLIGLHTASLVTSAAHEAARVVAAGNIDHQDPVAVARAQARAEQRARQLLGRYGESIRLDWSASDATTVVLRVEAAAPRFVPAGLSGQYGFGRIDRTVRARVERLQ